MSESNTFPSNLTERDIAWIEGYAEGKYQKGLKDGRKENHDLLTECEKAIESHLNGLTVTWIKLQEYKRRINDSL